VGRQAGPAVHTSNCRDSTKGPTGTNSGVYDHPQWSQQRQLTWSQSASKENGFCSLLLQNGTVPLNIFVCKSKWVSAVKASIDEGMVPVNLLLDKSKYSRTINVPKYKGMVPFNRLPCEDKLARAVNDANDEGMVPVNSLDPKYMYSKSVQAPSVVAGMVPIKTLKDNAR
jgi:hypothetical protein